MLTSQLIAAKVFVRLVSYQSDSDSDQLWLDRAGYFVAATAIIWAVTAFFSIGVAYYIIRHGQIGLGSSIVASLGGVAGITTAFFSTGEDKLAVVLKRVLAVAAPAFLIALVVGLSVALDLLLFSDSLVHALNAPYPANEEITLRILMAAIAAILVGTITSKTININSFSLQGMYKTTLVRGYLGAARQGRNPDRFTGFDPGDNVNAYTLWPPKISPDGTETHGLFHVINIALNVIDSKRLAWSDRRAEPFTVSPLHCGSDQTGFRSSKHYAGGISLGTAMAISSATSPNTSYYFSRSTRLLLALFNMRPGRWLGNPGAQGENSYKTAGPSFAVSPLIQEAFSSSTDNRPYVYLSGGGEFEALGLFEMVRRRCRFIVVVDAGQSARFEFTDLGNAVRKISIALGIRIRFDDLHLMKNRPADDSSYEERKNIPYHAIGVIEYGAADGYEDGCGDGTILYIKPALHNTENVGIVSYAESHLDFPYETIVDRSFTESQFESYRSLGQEIIERIFRTPGLTVSRPGQVLMTLSQLLAVLPETTRAAAT
jgi:hypothetical protein